MAKNPSKIDAPQSANLSVGQMERGVVTLKKRIAELENFEPRSADKNMLQAISLSVSSSIEQVFGIGTTDHGRYVSAAKLDQGPIRVTFGGPPENRKQYWVEGKLRSLTILNQAVATLQEKIADSSALVTVVNYRSANIDLAGLGNKVFIVHGHDDGMKYEIARYVELLGLEPVILDEQPNQGMTIIEKFEKQSVGYAVVLFSPDDVGSKKGDPAQPRARQNVVLELGYFAGKLGRKRVCAIVHSDDIELPSDIHGLVWLAYDRDWKLKLTRELREAGFTVDMNKAV